MSRWTVHGRRTMYESDWVNVYLDDVELPDGEHIDHHVLEFPKKSVGAVVVDDQERVLLIWRHRFITDTWGWEVPAGWVEPGEDPDDAIRREIEEETGYRVDNVEHMVDYYPLAGISGMRYAAYIGHTPTFMREVLEENETSQIAWMSLEQIRDAVTSGQMSDGPSLQITSYYIAFCQQLRNKP